MFMIKGEKHSGKQKSISFDVDQKYFELLTSKVRESLETISLFFQQDIEVVKSQLPWINLAIERLGKEKIEEIVIGGGQSQSLVKNRRSLEWQQIDKSWINSWIKFIEQKKSLLSDLENSVQPVEREEIIDDLLSYYWSSFVKVLQIIKEKKNLGDPKIIFHLLRKSSDDVSSLSKIFFVNQKLAFLRLNVDNDYVYQKTMIPDLNINSFHGKAIRLSGFEVNVRFQSDWLVSLPNKIPVINFSSPFLPLLGNKVSFYLKFWRSKEIFINLFDVIEIPKGYGISKVSVSCDERNLYNATSLRTIELPTDFSGKIWWRILQEIGLFSFNPTFKKLPYEVDYEWRSWSLLEAYSEINSYPTHLLDPYDSDVVTLVLSQ